MFNKIKVEDRLRIVVLSSPPWGVFTDEHDAPLNIGDERVTSHSISLFYSFMSTRITLNNVYPRI
jgi:hypothetical protein